MSTERALQAENLRLKRDNARIRSELDEAKAKITELEARLPKQPEASKDKPAVEKKPFNPWAPTGDPVFDALRKYDGESRRRSWLNE
jgi:hypothetical protein